jgi:hypothetical protein
VVFERGGLGERSLSNSSIAVNKHMAAWLNERSANTLQNVFTTAEKL